MMKILLIAVVLMSCAHSLVAADAATAESAASPLSGGAKSDAHEQGWRGQFESELKKIFVDARDELSKRMRTNGANESQLGDTERQQFEESKKTTARVVKKIKALRAKAADDSVPSDEKKTQTEYLAELDRIIAGLERSLKMTWEENQKIRAEFEKKILDLQKNFKRSEQPWRGTKICEALPFSVEYRHAHAFLAEYDKRIRFKSGKSVGIWMDTGGAGDFAVYALRDGKIYLIDGLKHLFIRSEYRIDSAAESVEKRCGETWVRIPDVSLGVTAGADSWLMVKTADGERTTEGGDPVGDSLTGKRYLGRITPRGEFITGEPGPPTENER